MVQVDYILIPNSVVFWLFSGGNIFFFWLFRTYSGIIRHSSYIDAVKLLFTNGSFSNDVSIEFCF
jgi:hypothetical protein